MAKNHSISTEIFGHEFGGAEQTVGPATLRRMYGNTLPQSFHPDRDGSVPVHTVTADLKAQGERALHYFYTCSEIVIPHTPEALAEF